MKKVQESSIPNLLQLHVKQIENCGGSVFKIFADQEKPAAAARLAVLSSLLAHSALLLAYLLYLLVTFPHRIHILHK